METHDLVPVDFHGATLFAMPKNGDVFVALRPIAEAIGLRWHGQFERVKRDPVLKEGVRELRTPSPGGVQNTLCLQLRLLNGWLFGISTNAIGDKAKRERILTYQRECYDVLADHFLGRRPGAADALAEAADASDITVTRPAPARNARDLALQIEQVKLMVRLKGTAHALALYESFGLPIVEPPAPPPADLSRDPVVAALMILVEKHGGAWSGSPTALLDALTRVAPDWAREHEGFPVAAQTLGTVMLRLGGEMARYGLIVRFKHSGTRTYTIEKKGNVEFISPGRRH